MTGLQLISPRFVHAPLSTCQDFTDNCLSVAAGLCSAESINTRLQNAFSPTTVPGGLYATHLVSVFQPLDPAAPSGPAELHLNAACVEGPQQACTPDPMLPQVLATTATNQGSTACYTPSTAEVNTRAGTPAAYVPGANTSGPACFRMDLPLLTLDLAGIVLPLVNATVSGTYAPSAQPTQVVSGVITGFLPETTAAALVLPGSLGAPLAGQPLYAFLQAGGRQVGGVAGGCNMGGGANEDDADSDGGVRGFRFFLNFEAETINWTVP